MVAADHRTFVPRHMRQNRRPTTDRLGQKANTAALLPQLSGDEAPYRDPADGKLGDNAADERGLPRSGSASEQDPRRIVRHIPIATPAGAMVITGPRLRLAHPRAVGGRTTVTYPWPWIRNRSTYAPGGTVMQLRLVADTAVAKNLAYVA
jgi:hypothetical protein